VARCDMMVLLEGAPLTGHRARLRRSRAGTREAFEIDHHAADVGGSGG